MSKQQIESKKVVFYFDGFNFYNGLKDFSLTRKNWKDYFWLDFVKFCSRFVFEHDGQVLHKVKYFTAPPSNEKKRSKQSALLNANKILNNQLFEVINGHYADKHIVCLAECKKSLLFLKKNVQISIFRYQ